ncbi:MAG: helix-turn-helix domain-containing protein [Actinobacteria bacterium]|nr:helix-turn-helix domain-containing protein [Actinomycetota bacterium]
MMTDSKDDILTIGQCAELLKVSTRTIYDLVSAERLPGKIFAKKVGRSWRILRREIERYMSEEPGTVYQMAFNQKIKK